MDGKRGGNGEGDKKTRKKVRFANNRVQRSFMQSHSVIINEIFLTFDP